MGLPEAGRDQGCVLAPVHIGIFPLIDRIIAGGPAEQVILWGVHRVFQRAGPTNAQVHIIAVSRKTRSFNRNSPPLLKLLEYEHTAGSQDDDYTADQQRHLQGGEIHACGRCAAA